jgi:hypothetical protein
LSARESTKSETNEIEAWLKKRLKEAKLSDKLPSKRDIYRERHSGKSYKAY